MTNTPAQKCVPIPLSHDAAAARAGEARRNSRPQALHLETDLIARPLVTKAELLQTRGAVDPVALINSHVSSSRSDSSASSIASSADESSIATPTLETATIPPTFTFSSPDNSTKLLLRDRYLESQRPIILGSSNNSLDIPRSVYQEQKNSAPPLLSIFTPPATPASANEKGVLPVDLSILPPKFLLEQKGEEEDIVIDSDCEDLDTEMGIDSNPSEHDDRKTGTLKPIGPYEFDDPVRPTKLGSGAWSNVYKGYLKRSKDDEVSLLIAIKTPLNNFSIPAVQREAEILSYVQRKVTSSSQYQSVIPFHGFDESTNSILLTALSGENLEQFTSRCRASQPVNASFNSRKLPMIGITQWLFVSQRLIGAFEFLKANGVIHGDIKPQNILIRKWENHNSSLYDWISTEEAANLVEPVVSDFSSAYIVDSEGNISDDEEPISAVTTIYCAPELLAAFLTPPTTPTKSYASPTSSPANGNGLAPPTRKNEPRPLPTFSSDLYGLCMTLLQCAIGSHPYAAAKMEIQKNIWVRQGDPMAFARSDERIFRCKVGGTVDRLLKGCFGKTSVGRAEVGDLRDRIDMLCQEWKDRKGQEQWVWGA